MAVSSMAPTSNPLAGAPAGRHRGDLGLFVALAFGLSWASWGAAMGLGGSAMTPPTALPYLFGAFGPLIAALVVRVRRRRRGEPVPEHAVRFRSRALAWLPLFLVATSATVLGAALLAQAAGGPALSLDGARDVMADAGGPAAFLVSMIVSGPLSEEPGWRGTAYPRMRASMGRLQVGLLLGVVWSVWHLPLFFIDGTVQNELGLATPSGMLFAVSVVPMAMLTAYAYERAGVVASMVTHFAANTTMILLDVHTPVTLALVVGLMAVVAAFLLTVSRSTSGPAPSAGPAPAPAPAYAEPGAPAPR
ncbi:CPBP family intramembrane glutamic endopeptidase [Streptomyces reniochalinae]|nr:CPBP family intramembrane glutamic endopeptidase [Streptomyces reniochalinae]